MRQPRINAIEDMSGRRYGRLLVIARAPTPLGKTKAFWRCVCDCGREILRSGTEIRRSESPHCGCGRVRAPKPKRAERIHERDTHPLHGVMRQWVGA